MNIVFAGTGYITKNHANAAKAQKNVELTSVVERISDKAAALCHKFRIQNQYLKQKRENASD